MSSQPMHHLAHLLGRPNKEVAGKKAVVSKSSGDHSVGGKSARPPQSKPIASQFAHLVPFESGYPAPELPAPISPQAGAAQVLAAAARARTPTGTGTPEPTGIAAQVLAAGRRGFRL